MTIDQRLQQLKLWLNQILETDQYDVTVASADASFRRYFRIQHNGQTMIAMDAPPEKEDCKPFVDIAKTLFAGDVHVPEVLAEDHDHGFLLLSDLGDVQYLSILNNDNADILYKQAIDSLIKLQSIDAQALPAYNRELLKTEMNLFPQWFIEKHLSITLSVKQQHLLDSTFECLTENALQQPAVFVHRDFHSRNLMQTSVSNPGILDFQDAVNGAITYDLASLLKDCYICWPRKQIEQWLAYYFQQAQQKKLIDTHYELNEFIQWFDLMSVQRHLKVLGIFSRLNIRDNKPGYMKDLPLTLQYIIDSCERYPLLQPLKTLLQDLKVADSMNINWQKLA